MAKSTVPSGPSFSDHEVSEQAEPHPFEVINRPVLGGELQSVGMPSSESSESDSLSNKQENQDPPLPAQTTENPSGQTDTADSSVPSTAGAGPGTKKPPSGRRSPTRKTGTSSSKANVRSTDSADEFDDFDE